MSLTLLFVICPGVGEKQGLVWNSNMLRSSRLVQASQSPCSFVAPLGIADRVTNPAFKAGLWNNSWVPEGREIPAEYGTCPP